MADYATTYAAAASRISFVWFKEPTVVGPSRTQTPLDCVVPALAKWARITATGVGGQGGAWGGGSAVVVAGVTVTPGETLKVQVGDTSTTTVAGDSFVKRSDGSVLAYADRGRGVGTQGQAGFSTGDVRRSGTPGLTATGGSAATSGANSGSGGGGRPGSTQGDQGDMGFGGFGMDVNTYAQTLAQPAADPGGGGQNIGAYNTDAEFMGYFSLAAGTGRVCIEFYTTNPGY